MAAARRRHRRHGRSGRGGTVRARRRVSRGALWFLLVAGAAAGAAGCGKALPGGGPDIAFIDQTKAEAKNKPPKVTAAGPLLPLTPGRTWRFLAVRSNKGKAETFATETSVAGPLRLGNGQTGTLLRSLRNGKVFRLEVLRAEKDGGLSLLGIGENEKRILTFDPPVPFARPPYEEGKAEFWRGTARIDGKEFAATGFTRLSSAEKLDTLAGDYVGYRFDHIVSVNLGARRIDYPAVYWLVPGVGIVRRRLADRGSVAVEDLKTAPPVVSR